MAAEVTANTTENKNSSTPTGIAASTKSPGQWEKSELQTTLQIEVTLKVWAVQSTVFYWNLEAFAEELKSEERTGVIDTKG